MDRFYSMQVFVRVAEMNSFTKAAESLGLPKASVSSYIQQLEAQIGTRLFHRTTRQVQLTQDGSMFYERSKDLLAEMEETETMFQKSTSLSGRIRVDMPIRMGKDLIIPRLPEFVKNHPQLEIEISSTDRKVDVVQEGFDCVIRVGNLSDSGLMARKIGEYKIVNCASPEYIKKYGNPKSIQDLNSHLLVHYAPVLGSKPFGFEYLDDGKYKNLKMKGIVTVNNSEAYQAACLSGLGIIQVPEVGVREAFKKKELIEILPKLKAEPMPVNILYPHRRNQSRRVKVFMDWVELIFKTI